MIIKIDKIIQKYGTPKGIIHIGAHLMEERTEYLSVGLENTIWIEGNADIYSKIKFINDITECEHVFNCIVSDVDNAIYDFNITNKTPSSSILKLHKHKIHHPHIHITDIIKVKSIRMDTLLSDNNINIENYDFINIDIQGAELLALKGFGDLLYKMNYIYCEVNIATLYEGCPLIYEIDSYLSLYGFHRVETAMTEFEWGDALYVKM
jgi:FkbM family methyltransferase